MREFLSIHLLHIISKLHNDVICDSYARVLRALVVNSGPLSEKDIFWSTMEQHNFAQVSCYMLPIIIISIFSARHSNVTSPIGGNMRNILPIAVISLTKSLQEYDYRMDGFCWEKYVVYIMNFLLILRNLLYLIANHGWMGMTTNL